MASIITGRNASIGPVPTPSGPARKPSWKTRVTTPNAAPAASRFITAAVRGISRLRNAIISSRQPSSTITKMNNGSLSGSTPAKSSQMAVIPPTETGNAAETRGDPADVDGQPRRGPGDHVVAQGGDQPAGRRVLRRGRRPRLDQR